MVDNREREQTSSADFFKNNGVSKTTEDYFDITGFSREDIEMAIVGLGLMPCRCPNNRRHVEFLRAWLAEIDSSAQQTKLGNSNRDI